LSFPPAPPFPGGKRKKHIFPPTQQNGGEKRKKIGLGEKKKIFGFTQSGKPVASIVDTTEKAGLIIVLVKIPIYISRIILPKSRPPQ